MFRVKFNKKNEVIDIKELEKINKISEKRQENIFRLENSNQEKENLRKTCLNYKRQRDILRKELKEG